MKSHIDNETMRIDHVYSSFPPVTHVHSLALQSIDVTLNGKEINEKNKADPLLAGWVLFAVAN